LLFPLGQTSTFGILPPGHDNRSQFVPVYAPKQLHVFGAVHAPFPEQTVGSLARMELQIAYWQSSPPYPVEHVQLSGELHVPWLEQTVGSVETTPEHVGYWQ